jgi:hypothetical protein
MRDDIFFVASRFAVAAFALARSAALSTAGVAFLPGTAGAAARFFAGTAGGGAFFFAGTAGDAFVFSGTRGGVFGGCRGRLEEGRVTPAMMSSGAGFFHRVFFVVTLT